MGTYLTAPSVGQILKTRDNFVGQFFKREKKINFVFLNLPFFFLVFICTKITLLDQILAILPPITHCKLDGYLERKKHT